MNEKINADEHFSMRIKRPFQSGVVPMGIVKHYIDGRLVLEKRNAIQTELFDYLVASMDSVVNNAIDNLMNASEVQPGSTQDTRDGIAIFDNTNGVFKTMTVATAVPVEQKAKRWVGSVNLSVAFDVNQAVLGHSYQAGNPPFLTPYALQNFTALALTAGALYEVDWEIFLTTQ